MSYYNDSDFGRLKVKFDGAISIKQNYSQAYQDMFVLSVLNGKKNGTFVEVGANDGSYISNTYLLEGYQWTGLSIDMAESSRASFGRHERTAKHITQDALTLDYRQLFEDNNMPTQIDYLQLDIDPAPQTFECLLRMPLDKYRFSVITYESDYHRIEIPEREHIRIESRRILSSHGYVLIAGDVCNEMPHPFEDWWVDPSVVNRDMIALMKKHESFMGVGRDVILHAEY